MDESSLQTLWQEQPIDRAVPSELALELTHAPTSDVARPTSHFRQSVPAKERPWSFFAFAALAATLVLSYGVFVVQWRVARAPAPAPQGAARSSAEELETLLAECRTYSNTEAGMVDWDRARTACNLALELEPIHSEANVLVKRIAVLQKCEADLEGAKQQLALGRSEDALERLALIHRGCEGYLLRALTLAKAPVAEVKKRAASDCLAYAKNEKWDVALRRCEVYARYACQAMAPDEVSPRASMRVKLRGTLNPKTDWRPSDPVLVAFLESREKLQLAPTWQCPELIALRPPHAPPDPGKLAKEELARRYQEPLLGRALVAYFQGDLQSAPVQLQKVLEDMGKAEHHAQARALQLDVGTAISLYENGNTELLNDRPEKAALIFGRALEVDARLVLGDPSASLGAQERRRQLELRASFVRKAIVETMTSASYVKGRDFADRRDFRAACRMWKLGSDFNRSSIDLLKALTNVCTRRAQESFENAQSCEELRVALDFAVEGDGFKEKIGEAMAAESCR